MVSLKDIARELGVSVGTVSMALRGSPRIGRETASRVKALAGELGYIPNHFGRGLRSGRSALIGCLVSSLQASFMATIVEAIGARAAEAQYSVLAAWSDGRREKMLQDQLELMLSKNIDGLVITNPVLAQHPALLARLNRAQVPFIFCSYHCGDQGYPFVVTDDEAGGRLAARHLLDNGHRAILCEFSHSVERRLKGNLAEINCRPDARSCVFHDLEELPVLIAEQRATAIVSYSDMRAIDTIYLLRQRGIRVPEDVSIIGYDDLDLAARPEFNLTTIAQQRKQLGIAAVDYIFERLGGNAPADRILLAPSLVERGTVRRVG